METGIVFLSFAALITLGLSQDVQMSISPMEMQKARVGDKDITFVCAVNKGPFYLMQNPVQFVHKGLNEDGTENERLISQLAQNMDADPAFYKPNSGRSEENTDDTLVSLTILEVRDIDDGTFSCRLVDKVGNIVVEKSVELMVERDVEQLQLTFFNKQPTEVTVTAVEGTKQGAKDKADAGTYKVQCISKGSNPEPEELRLSFDGNTVETGAPATSYITGGYKKIEAMISADVELDAKDSGKSFECYARSTMGTELSVTLDIMINTYDPVVTCDETSAYVGKKYPIIVCYVDHSGLKVTGYKYMIGTTGQMIAPGDPPRTQVADNAQVTVEKISDTKSKVMLDLYQAKQWHFNTEYKLLTELDNGHVSETPVTLTKEAGDDAGKLVMGPLTIVVMCVLCWLTRRML